MKGIVTFSFISAIIGSLISQLPSFVVSGTGGFLKFFWVFPFIFMLIDRPKEYFDEQLRPFYFFVMLFITYCFVMEAFSLKQYFTTDITNMSMDIVVLAISFKFWKSYRSKKVLFLICLSMLICAVFLSYRVYYDYFVEQDIFSRQYAYASKNSLGIILLSAILFPVIAYKPNHLIIRTCWWILTLLVLYVVIIMRSRSVIGGIVFLYLYFVIKSKKIEMLIFSILLTGLTFAYIYYNPEMYSYVFDGIISAGRDYSDIDDFSSGRVHAIEEGWPLFLKNMHFGVGGYYLDCMPIAMLIQYGIWGSLILFAYLLFIGLKLYSHKEGSRVELTSFLLYVVFSINSLFEAQAPFGPGVKCFILWMLIGFSLANLSLKRNHETLSNIQ